MAGKLTARFAATVTEPGRHGDGNGNGLYLMVKPGGSKSWVLRTFVRGRQCDIGLGGYRTDNPAGDAIAAALPKVSDTPKHFRAVHHSEAGDVIRMVRESQASLSVRLAFEFLVLTAARSGEVRGALWSEFDMETAIWTIPGERMKGAREHRVPLSSRALEILDEARELDDGSGLVFPAPAGGRPTSASTLSELLRELDIGAVPHGFRSTFRDWCSESAQVPREVAEACLAHVVKGAEGAYARSDLLDRRRKLMDRWAAYLASDAGETVVPMARP